MENNEMIEKYLKGQLTPEEEKAFREKFQNDKDLREEVLITVQMIKHMKEENQTKEDAIVNEANDTNVAAATVAAASIPLLHHWHYWAASIAALFVIGFFSAKPVYFSYKSNQMLAQNYAQWTPKTDGVTRGADRGEVQAGENVVAELSELFDNVGNGKDMKMTTYRLEQALKESETNYVYNQYAPDIAWYLALAYIQENEFGKARILLDAIIESEDPDYSAPAEKLYKEIENMYFM